MWRVEYTNVLKQRVFWPVTFPTRKSARLWCKKSAKPAMILYGPDGEIERFHRAFTFPSQRQRAD